MAIIEAPLTLEQLGEQLLQHFNPELYKIATDPSRQNYYDAKTLETFGLTNPQLLKQVAKYMAKMVSPRTNRLAALETCAVPVGTAVSLETQRPLVMVRRYGKSYGTAKMIEGEYHPGDQLALIVPVHRYPLEEIMAIIELRREYTIANRVLSVVRLSDAVTKSNAQMLNEDGVRHFSLFTYNQSTHTLIPNPRFGNNK